jgi:hypothetical protein
MKDIRWSNMELCRIFAIICVMLLHSTFSSLGYDVSFGVYLLAGFSIIGVNTFVMLTGYFSATPKKSSLISIAFMCLFWTIIKVIFHYSFNEELNYKDFFFITKSNWFIPSYIFLLFFSPILNVFCDSVNKKTLLHLIISLLIIITWFDWLPPYPDISLGSISALFFLIIYLLARYIRLYGLPTWFKNASLIIYIVCSLFLGILGYSVKENHSFVALIIYNGDPIVIISSVAFLTTFSQLNFHSKIINHLAKSVLACLLGHVGIYFLYTKHFKHLYYNYSNFKVIFYWIFTIAILFITSVLIDQIRIYLWTHIKIHLKTFIKNDKIFELPNTLK